MTNSLCSQNPWPLSRRETTVRSERINPELQDTQLMGGEARLSSSYREGGFLFPPLMVLFFMYFVLYTPQAFGLVVAFHPREQGRGAFYLPLFLG